MQFLSLKTILKATLTLLRTAGVIAVDAWDRSRSGQATSKPSNPFWLRLLPAESDDEPNNL